MSEDITHASPGNPVRPEPDFSEGSRFVGIRVSGFLALTAVCSCLATLVGFWMGSTDLGWRYRSTPDELKPLLAASAASTDTMAVATGPISEDAEGIFFLDFITGDLQCLVYYPRYRGFGAYFATNVLQRLGGGGKNSQYILVTGGAVTRTNTAGARPGSSLVYVTDATSGMFAAYEVPWNRTAESSGRQQSGSLLYVGGGPVRNFQLNDPVQNAPAAVVDPNKNP